MSTDKGRPKECLGWGGASEEIPSQCGGQSRDPVHMGRRIKVPLMKELQMRKA